MQGRQEIATRMRETLNGLPGITTLDVPDGVLPSWYGMILRYKPDDLGGLPIDRFCDALS